MQLLSQRISLCKILGGLALYTRIVVERRGGQTRIICARWHSFSAIFLKHCYRIALFKKDLGQPWNVKLLKNVLVGGSRCSSICRSRWTIVEDIRFNRTVNRKEWKPVDGRRIWPIKQLETIEGEKRVFEAEQCVAGRWIATWNIHRHKSVAPRWVTKNPGSTLDENPRIESLNGARNITRISRNKGKNTNTRIKVCDWKGPCQERYNERNKAKQLKTETQLVAAPVAGLSLETATLSEKRKVCRPKNITALCEGRKTRLTHFLHAMLKIAMFSPVALSSEEERKHRSASLEPCSVLTDRKDQKAGKIRE